MSHSNSTPANSTPARKNSHRWINSEVFGAIFNSTVGSFLVIGPALYFLVEILTGQKMFPIVLAFYALAIADAVMRYRQLRGKKIPLKETYRRFSSWENNLAIIAQVTFLQIILIVFIIWSTLFK